MAIFPSLTQRNVQPELMDDPSLAEALHLDALRGLASLNQLSFAVSGIWRQLAANLPNATGRPLRVLDLACGGGDITIGLQQRAEKAGREVDFDGCDMSETALTRARNLADRSNLPCRFRQRDVINQPLPEGYDAIITSLFLHHLTTDDATKLLRNMSSAAPLAIVDDLLRSQFNYVLTWLGTRVVTRSPIVHNDGPFSVRAAFTINELTEIANSAGLEDAKVHSRFPCRMQLVWRRSA